MTLQTLIETIYLEKNKTNSAPLSLSGMLENIDAKIKVAQPIIFSFDYPAFDNLNDKQHLEFMILSHYYTREICCDSVSKWQMLLRDRLNQIMPKYVEIYKAQAKLLAKDIFNPYDLTETKKGDSTKNRTDTLNSTNDSNGSNKNVSDSTTTTNNTNNSNTTTTDEESFSDLPQAQLVSGSDYATTKSGRKGSENSETTDNGTSTNNSTSTDTLTNKTTISNNGTSDETKTDNYTKTFKGNIGNQSFSLLTKQYYDVIINLEKMIIDELYDLFFLVY